jgi:lipopolysaccharide transport system ATP-binding protein
MADTAISVENLAKKYIITHQKGGSPHYKTFRGAMTNTAKSLAAALDFSKKKVSPTKEEFWALKDVSFEIKRGDRVGIIGRNGAGKSTLLKVLSRITEPTRGAIRIKGRVASLLEVGTGFHPELTGRENIFLNGAILGMSKVEIQRKFDEIVAFAEIERFLDTPVKRYSSGMYVRLAFAVAAHLEPEILIVDEVLAVGDMQFQKKCMTKMQDVGKQGRTVLFVSHNMHAVHDLCSTSILLKQGQVASVGLPKDVIDQYLSAHDELSTDSIIQRHTENFCIKQVKCFGHSSDEPILPFGELTIEIEVSPHLPTRDLSLHILILKEDDSMCYLGYDSVDFKAFLDNVKNTTIARFTLKLPHCPLPPGRYYIDAYPKSYSNQVFEKVERIAKFSVAEKAVYGSRLYDEKWHGRCLSPAMMQVEELRG